MLTVNLEEIEAWLIDNDPVREKCHKLIEELSDQAEWNVYRCVRPKEHTGPCTAAKDLFSWYNVKAMFDELEYLRDFKETMVEDFKRVVNNECYPDAQHCSCVFHLRAEIERLKAIQPSILDGLAEAEVDLEPDEMKF